MGRMKLFISEPRWENNFPPDNFLFHIVSKSSSCPDVDGVVEIFLKRVWIVFPH